MQATDKLVVSSHNPQKLDFLLELLRHLPEVEVQVLPQAASANGDGAEADFWALAGIWKDRMDIDLEKSRREAFERRTSS